MNQENDAGVEQVPMPILVNGEAVPEGMLEQELQLIHERYSKEMSYSEMEESEEKIVSDARENAVERLLLIQEARVRFPDVRSEEVEAHFLALKQQHGGDEEFDQHFELSDDDILRIKSEIADSLRLETYFEEICKDVVRPTEADAQMHYDAELDDFKIPERVKASHIIQQPTPEKPSKVIYAELLNVRERLKAGDDFDVVAAECSHCGDGGQDLGYFVRGDMVPAFEKVAFATEVGAFSDVFQTEFGYHILKVSDRKPAEMQTFEEVRYEIESMLFDERKNDAIGCIVDGLRAAASIENLETVED